MTTCFKKSVFYLFILLYSCKAYRPIIDSSDYLKCHNSQQTVFADHGGVASAHPLASKVGISILRKGGNAIDAAIAMQLALAVVYPQAGNLGGGGFMIMRFKDGAVKTLDFREKAPMAAYKDMYLDSVGSPNVEISLTGHLATGIPGTIAGIFESLKYARLPFGELIQPSIDLAEQGYSYRVDMPYIRPGINTIPNVFESVQGLKPGQVFKQPDLASTLKRIQENGRKEFYEGKTARLIVEEMKRGGGIITMSDLKNYQAKWREPIRFSYRGYDIISMGLPSSGGILLNQMLKMVERYPLQDYGWGSVASINLMIEAERRAFKDRATYLGDADFRSITVQNLVGEDHIKELMSDYVPGVAGVSSSLASGVLPVESRETTHLSVVDAEGNAVAVTTTLNGAYGSRVVVGGAGFLLNNQMNDFSIKPGTNSYSGGIGGVNNSIEPGKRMLSSMTPTIILKDDKLFMVIGTPGGTTIPTSVFQAIVGVIDFGMTATQAVLQPKFHHEWMPDKVQLNMSRFSADTVSALKKIGYAIVPGGFSSLEVIRAYSKGASNSLEIISQHGSAEGY